MGFELNLDKFKAATANLNTAGVSASETSRSPIVDNSVFESNNASSMTVIVSNSYAATVQAPDQALGKINFDSNDGQMEELINSRYGNLTEEQRNSAAAAILDNNRWMIDGINKTYKIAQVAQDLSADIEEENQQTVYEAAAALVDNPSNFNIEDYKNQLDSDAYNKLEKQYLDVVQSKIENDGYEQFARDVRTDKIPPEIIMAADFSNDAGNEYVFCPQISTLSQEQASDESGFTKSIAFNSNEKNLNIDVSDMDEQEAQQAIEKAIAENYGLEDLKSLKKKKNISA